MRPASRVLLLGAASAVVVGCSLLTSLDGLSGGAEPDGGGGERGESSTEAGTADGPAEAGSDAPPVTTGSFIVAAGGTKGSVDFADVYVARIAADGSLGTWKTSAQLPAARSKAAIAVRGSTIFLTGGNGAGGVKDSTFVATFGPDTVSAWTQGTSLPTVLFRHGSFEYQGDVYVVGGSDPSARTAVLRTTPAADGTITSFRSDLNLPTPRASAGVVRSDNHVFVIAGEQPPDGGGATVPTAAGWVGPLDSAGSVTEWRDVTPLPNTTEQPGIAATSTHLYVSGGYSSGRMDAVVASPIATDGSLGTWAPASAMTVGRAGHRMVVAGGRLYVIGGVDGTSASLSSVEVADIAADGTLGPFRLTMPLPDGRAFMVVALFER